MNAVNTIVLFAITLSANQVTSLKLLQNDFPTTPYKAVGPNSRFDCAAIEKYATLGTAHYNKQCKITTAATSGPLKEGAALTLPDVSSISMNAIPAAGYATVAVSSYGGSSSASNVVIKVSGAGNEFTGVEVFEGGTGASVGSTLTISAGDLIAAGFTACDGSLAITVKGADFPDAHVDDPLAPTAGSPCDLALTPALDAWAANLEAKCGAGGMGTCSGADATLEAKLVSVADLCCQKQNKPQKAIGKGKARLSGLSSPNSCKGFWITYNTRGTSKAAAVKFYDAVSGSAAAGGGCQTEAAAEATDGNRNIVRVKAAEGAPNHIAPANGTKLTNAFTACSTPGNAVCTNNKLLSYARSQCAKKGKGAWTLPYVWPDGTSTLAASADASKISCAGFCLKNDATNTNNFKFYPPNTCYLESTAGTSSSRCYSSIKKTPASVDMPKAFNDPKVVNMAGESFDILATGTFSMLQMSSTTETKVSITATIDRAGSVCGATYIQNVTISGAWLSGAHQVQVRAAAAVPKKTALEVSVDDADWRMPSLVAKRVNASAEPGRFKLHLMTLEIDLSVDSHRIVESSKKTRRFANFLNMNIKGLKSSLNSQLTASGLLSSDSHTDVARLPESCKPEEVKLLSQVVSGDDESCPIEECGASLPDDLPDVPDDFEN